MITSELTINSTITLITDAKARTDRFAICYEDGTPAWYGRFFDNDQDYTGEQSTGEMAAAKKAVWLASKLGCKSLTLKVDAEWLTWANDYEPGTKTGGKARYLAMAADKLGVALKVVHIAGRTNPADAYTVCQGFKKYDLEEGATYVK